MPAKAHLLSHAFKVSEIPSVLFQLHYVVKRQEVICSNAEREMPTPSLLRFGSVSQPCKQTLLWLNKERSVFRKVI